MEKRRDVVGWGGPFRRGQACPYNADRCYRAEYPGGNGVYYYISTDRLYEQPAMDLACAAKALKTSLNAAKIDERLAWLIQQPSGEYALFPCGRMAFGRFFLLPYNIEGAEGIVYPSSGSGRREVLPCARITGMGIQLCRAGSELREKGLSLGSPGVWAVYVEPNRHAKVIGGGLGWIYEGEELPEAEDVAYAKEFLLSFTGEKGSEDRLALRCVLQDEEAVTFKSLAERLETLYASVYGVGFASRKTNEPPAFEEMLDRAIGVGNLGRKEEFLSLMKALKESIYEARDDESALRFWNNYAAALVMCGQAEEGLRMLEDRGAEETGLTWNYRAWAYEKIGKTEDADRAYRYSLALEGGRRDTLLNYASFCVRHAMRESFDELYPKMLEVLGEHDSDVWMIIGDFLSACGSEDVDLVNALEAYDRAMESGGDETFITLKKLRVSVQRNGESCRDEARGMLERDDLDALSWNELGLIYQYLSDYDNAVRCFTRALESIPDETVFAANVMCSLLDALKAEEAVAFAREWLSRGNGTPDAHFWSLFGDAYNNTADYVNCVECLVKAGELDPVNECYAPRIVNALVMQGRGEDAVSFGLECCRKAYECSAGIDPANDMIGILRLNGNCAEAVSFGEERLALEGRSPDLDFWHELGSAYGDLGNYAKSEECFRNALDLDPGNGFYISQIIVLLSKSGKGEDAVNFAIECCMKQYELNPAVDLAARILFESDGQWKAEEATAFGEEWLSQREGEVSAGFWGNIGYFYKKLGNSEKHEECLRKSIELDWSGAGNARDMIELLLDKGKAGEAAAFGEEWLSKQTRAIDPFSGEAFWNMLGLAYDRLGEYDRAANCFRMSYELLPVNVMDSGNRAGALMKTLFEQGKKEEAITFGLECCRKAHEFSLSAVTACDIMDVLRERGKGGEAAIFGEEWLSQGGDSISAGFWTVLGLAHMDSGDYMKGEEYCRRAHELNPENSHFAGHVVKMLRLRERSKDAVAFGEEWLSKGAGETFRYFWEELGTAYKNAGDTVQCEECVRRASECAY